MTADARTDLNDPRGLIVSRALSNPERTLRLPLNASQAQASAAGRFMERTAGAGAQHVAFACRDIIAAAARLPAALRLPIPENYYEDLAARFALDDALVERLRAELDPLRPCRARASSSTCSPAASTASSSSCSSAAAYDRYGEANAPVRLAAQAAFDRSAAEVLTAITG